MKKISKLLIVLISVLTVSCTAEGDRIVNVETSAVQQVINEKNATVQRLMYNLLTPQDKQLIWAQKLDELINSQNLNQQQVKLLSEVKSVLTIEYFDNQIVNDEKEIIKVYYMKSFLKKAQTFFTTDFIYSNFYKIDPKKNNLRTAPLDDFTNCGCYRGSIWTCGIVSPVTCKIPANYCRESHSGCGLWYDYPCNGECRS